MACEKTIQLRPMGIEDRPVLAALYAAVREEIGYASGEDFDADTRDEEVIVALRSGDIAGFASVYRPGDFLHHLYVAREHRGFGVGSALLSACGSGLRLKAEESNRAAIDFYTRRGWRELSREDGVVQLAGP